MNTPVNTLDDAIAMYFVKGFYRAGASNKIEEGNIYLHKNRIIGDLSDESGKFIGLGLRAIKNGKDSLVWATIPQRRPNEGASFNSQLTVLSSTSLEPPTEDMLAESYAGFHITRKSSVDKAFIEKVYSTDNSLDDIFKEASRLIKLTETELDTLLGGKRVLFDGVNSNTLETEACSKGQTYILKRT